MFGLRDSNSIVSVKVYFNHNFCVTLSLDVFSVLDESHFRMVSIHIKLFSQHSASEWAVGNKRTAGVGTYVGKLVSPSLRGRATRVVTLLTNLKFDLLEMEDFLGRKNETKSWEDVACEWIISNGDRWDKWIPKENTACIRSRVHSVRG